jgi:carbon monoxide dehydrogenase subunit G
VNSGSLRKEHLILRIALISAAIVAVVIGAVLIVAARKPDTLSIARSIEIQAAPEKIFALIDDFHNWSQWAPQDREDPSIQRTFNGPASGVGAESEWTSKGRAGTGRMAITESVAPERVTVDVHFVKPFVAHNVNTFMLEPDRSATKVIWSMKGTNVYMLKLMSVLVDMDRMMGEHFESGLRDLKSAAER